MVRDPGLLVSRHQQGGAVSELPTGTVTFLFTDLESSTRLWEEHPDAMRAALERHDVLLRDSVTAHGGRVVKGTGDGLHAVFPTAGGALDAAVAAQVALGKQAWAETGPLRVRMGLHTGVAEQREGDYFGPVLNRTARLMSAAHPGQVLCSQATADLVTDSLPPSVGLIELGPHRLQDLTRAEVIFQITHSDLPTDFPPLHTLDAFPGNLPVQRTTLIGRSAELAKLADLLQQHRLVTLTGVGGVGKTRLAVQLAAGVLDRFPDGAWLVALGSIRDLELVPNATATALEIAERPGRPLIDTLSDAIGSREMLVVLDNCEHLLEATARLVDVLLDACPALRIVATSREALGVDGEQSWPTPSLKLPVVATSATLEELASAASVELFVERAQAVRPDFALSPANAPAVAALCTRLDGIPLAIELAAARVGALGPQDIVERIDQRFLLLTGGSRTALERHQTLQAAVDWSYDLLSDGEQRLFERLSVFAGGLTPDAAHAVAANEGTDEVGTLDLLGSLVAKSMVLAEGSAASVRYRLLETLRQYGRNRLAASGDAPAIRDRHASYFLEFAEALRPISLSPEQVLAWDRLTVEIDNMRAAFNWLIDSRQPAIALQLVGATFAGWSDTGELLRLREAALGAADALDPGDLVEPLARTAASALNAGEHERARYLAKASLDRAREAGIAPHPVAFMQLGLAAFWQNDPTSAVEALEESVALARSADDGSSPTESTLAQALSSLNFVLGQTGSIPRAILVGDEAVSIARKIGAPTLLSACLFNLALAYQATNPERAARLLDESLEHSIGTRWPYQYSWVLIATGQVRGTLGDHAGALDAFGEVLTLARQSGERFFLPTTLQGMARALRHLDRLDEAARMLGAAQGLADQLGITGGPADVASRERAGARLRDLLGDDRFEAEWEAGSSLSVDGAITQAIASTASPERPTSWKL
jgi:predicted ATPase/class 3 adenylate cyclase